MNKFVDSIFYEFVLNLMGLIGMMRFYLRVLSLGGEVESVITMIRFERMSSRGIGRGLMRCMVNEGGR